MGSWLTKDGNQGVSGPDSTPGKQKDETLPKGAQGQSYLRALQEHKKSYQCKWYLRALLIYRLVFYYCRNSTLANGLFEYVNFSTILQMLLFTMTLVYTDLVIPFMQVISFF